MRLILETSLLQLKEILESHGTLTHEQLCKLTVDWQRTKAEYSNELSDIVLPSQQALLNIAGKGNRAEMSRQLHSALITVPRRFLADHRLLAHLSLVEYFDLTQQLRRTLIGKDGTLRPFYLHVMGTKLSQAQLLRHAIGGLIWPARILLSSGSNRGYQLLCEYFNHADYYSLFGGALGAYAKVWVAVLGFVVDHQDIFRVDKESRIRTVFRELNYMAATQPISFLDEVDLTRIIVNVIEKGKESPSTGHE